MAQNAFKPGFTFDTYIPTSPSYVATSPVPALDESPEPSLTFPETPKPTFTLAETQKKFAFGEAHKFVSAFGQSAVSGTTVGRDVSSKDRKEEKKKVEWGMLQSPWREVGFSVEKNEALLDSVSSCKLGCDAVSAARVLLLGPVGAGKSSFISSVHSVFSGKVINRAMVGTSSTSFTQKLQSYTFRRIGKNSNQPVPLVLCDAMGLGMDGMTGLTLHDVLAVIKGHAPEGHKFSADQPLMAETVGYVKKPSAREKMHCVAFVTDATKIDSYSKGMGSTFQLLRERISDLGVHQVALLTHVDQLSPEAACDITKVYRSRLVQHTMEKAAALLGMPMSYIVPVKNYSCELDVDEPTNTLLLCAVQHILHYAELYCQDFSETRLEVGITSKAVMDLAENLQNNGKYDNEDILLL